LVKLLKEKETEIYELKNDLDKKIYEVSRLKFHNPKYDYDLINYFGGRTFDETGWKVTT